MASKYVIAGQKRAGPSEGLLNGSNAIDQLYFVPQSTNFISGMMTITNVSDNSDSYEIIVSPYTTVGGEPTGVQNIIKLGAILGRQSKQVNLGMALPAGAMVQVTSKYGNVVFTLTGVEVPGTSYATVGG